MPESSRSGAISAPAQFELNGNPRPSLQHVGGRIPVLVIDQIFAQPKAVRAAALQLPFQPFHYGYPGRIAEPERGDPALQSFLATMLAIVNGAYLPRIPPIAADGRPIKAFRTAVADYAIADLHPDELTPAQRRPHTDPVPVFGLIYLSEDERGGTMFFDRLPVAREPERSGYLTRSDAEFSLIGKVEGLFNRLVIYPGFVPHTAELAGDWIRTDERFKAPRLTQRIVFFP